MQNRISWYVRIRSERRQILVFLQRPAATFLPRDQQTVKILLRHAISSLLMVSAKLHDAYQFCVSTKA
jgi:hypothetical protein